MEDAPMIDIDVEGARWTVPEPVADQIAELKEKIARLEAELKEANWHIPNKYHGGY